MSTRNSSRFTPIIIAISVVAGILIGTFYAKHFAGNRLGIHQRFFQQAECAVENRRRSICRHRKHDRPRREGYAADPGRNWTAHLNLHSLHRISKKSIRNWKAVSAESVSSLRYRMIRFM